MKLFYLLTNHSSVKMIVSLYLEKPNTFIEMVQGGINYFTDLKIQKKIRNIDSSL